MRTVISGRRRGCESYVAAGRSPYQSARTLGRVPRKAGGYSFRGLSFGLMGRGQRTRSALGSPIGRRPAVPPRAATAKSTAAGLYSELLENDLVAEISRDITDRLRRARSAYQHIPLGGIPRGSAVQELLPALYCWRYTDRPLADYDRLRKKILDHMSRHLRDIDNALKAPDLPKSQQVLSAFGLRDPGDLDAAQMARDDLLNATANIRYAHGRASERFEDEADTYRMQILTRLLNQKLATLLSSGQIDLAQHLRSAHLASLTGGSSIGAGRLSQGLARKVCATAALDLVRPPDSERNWIQILSGREDMIRDDLRHGLSSRLRGDAEELQLAKNSRLSLGHSGPSVCQDASDALSQARGLLRNPYVSSEYRSSCLETMSTRKPLISVVVTTEALQELDEQLRDSDGWRGYWVVAPDVSTYLGEPHTEAQWTRRPSSRAVSLRLEVAEGWAQAEINFIAPIGEIRARGDEGRMAEVYAKAENQLGPQIADELDLPSAPWVWDGLSIGFADNAVGSASTPGDALGPDVCEHPGAEWKPMYSGGSKVCDTVALACPRCLRQRITTVPLHRLPEDHGVSKYWFANHEDEYLALERAHSLLAGKPPCESIADLRARDGVASLSPSDYAVGVPSSPKPAVKSIAAAMNRR